MCNSLLEIELMIQKTYEETFRLGCEVAGYEFLSDDVATYVKTKWNAPFINGVIHFNDQCDSLEEEVLRVHNDLKENNRSYIWRFHPCLTRGDELEVILLDLGLTQYESHTSVYSDINQDMIQKYSFKNQLFFNPVTIENFDDWFMVFSDAFEVSGSISDFFEAYEIQNAKKKSSIYKSYIGYFNNRPVASVSTVKTSSPLGALFNIASLKKERGKSFGIQASLHGAKMLLETNKSMVGQFGSKLGVQSYTKLGARLGNEYKQFLWQV